MRIVRLLDPKTHEAVSQTAIGRIQVRGDKLTDGRGVPISLEMLPPKRTERLKLSQWITGGRWDPKLAVGQAG